MKSPCHACQYETEHKRQEPCISCPAKEKLVTFVRDTTIIGSMADLMSIKAGSHSPKEPKDDGRKKPIETDPNGIKPGEPGSKLDAGKIKAGVLSDFALALTAVAEVGTFGANKYSRGGWQHVPDGIERYSDALWRHLLKERHGDVDPDSGLLHAAHLAWNALSRLELMLREVL